MSRYFFHMRMIDDTLIVDINGIEVTDLAAARGEAIEAVIEMTHEKELAGERPSIKAIEIADEGGEIVSVILFEAPHIH